MKKTRRSEQGIAHVVALLGFVLLVAVVGFVGYNAWQKSRANAGTSNTVGTSSGTPDATKPATYRYGNYSLCRMYRNLYGIVPVANTNKAVVKIYSKGKQILSYDTSKHKAGTHYFTSGKYSGSLQDAVVKYSIKTPTTKTVVEKTKNGKKKNVTKTVWVTSSNTVIVSSLPRCVPTNDVKEFNFYGGGADGSTNVCANNGELVYRWMFKKKNTSSSKSGIVASIDGKAIKTTYTAKEKANKYYYGRIAAKGERFKLYWKSDLKRNSRPSVLVNRTISSIKSCL